MANRLQILLLSILPFCSAAVLSQLPFGIELSSFHRDANTPGLYESLTARHVGCDTTLTHDELILLYYGAVFRPEFNPEKWHAESINIEAANEGGNHQAAAQMAMESLLMHPANVSNYLNLALARHHLGDSVGAKCAILAYYRLLSIPYYSGDGSRENPFWAIRPADELLILRELDFEYLSAAAQPPLDIVRVRDALNDVELDIHFNLGISTLALVLQEPPPAPVLTKKQQKQAAKKAKRQARQAQKDTKKDKQKA